MSKPVKLLLGPAEWLLSVFEVLQQWERVNIRTHAPQISALHQEPNRQSLPQRPSLPITSWSSRCRPQSELGNTWNEGQGYSRLKRYSIAIRTIASGKYYKLHWISIGKEPFIVINLFKINITRMYKRGKLTLSKVFNSKDSRQQDLNLHLLPHHLPRYRLLNHFTQLDARPLRWYVQKLASLNKSLDLARLLVGAPSLLSPRVVHDAKIACQVATYYDQRPAAKDLISELLNMSWEPVDILYIFSIDGFAS